MKVFLVYEDNENIDLHKTLKITLPKSWKAGPTSKVLGCFVESYNDNEKHASNPLDQEQMHLAIRPEGAESSNGGDESNHPLIPIASDAITIETIPDRSNVCVLHGPSKTMEEMEAEKKEALEKERAERANTVACQHFGCKNRFPKGGPHPDCSHRPSPSSSFFCDSGSCPLWPVTLVGGNIEWTAVMSFRESPRIAATSSVCAIWMKSSTIQSRWRHIWRCRLGVLALSLLLVVQLPFDVALWWVHLIPKGCRRSKRRVARLIFSDHHPPPTMKVFLVYEDNENSDLHKTLKITLPKSWKAGPTSKVLGCFVESYNDNEKHASNPLDQEQMHLAIRPEGAESSNGGDESNHPLIPIASDAITIETIPDRSNVYILHGPSKTMEEMEAEKKEALEKERAERANTVACQHFGCKNRFPKGGPYPDCSYHKSPPVFHETAKFWSCCPNKKAYDWEEFQSIPGCCTGVCTEVKESEQKQFLGGCDLREEAAGGAQLKSIDDFNKAQESGSDAAPVLERLRNVLFEIGVENELYDQVVEGIKKEMDGDDTPLDAVAAELGKKLKSSMKNIAAEQLRIK